MQKSNKLVLKSYHKLNLPPSINRDDRIAILCQKFIRASSPLDFDFSVNHYSVESLTTEVLLRRKPEAAALNKLLQYCQNLFSSANNGMQQIFGVDIIISPP